MLSEITIYCNVVTVHSYLSPVTTYPSFCINLSYFFLAPNKILVKYELVKSQKNVVNLEDLICQKQKL